MELEVLVLWVRENVIEQTSEGDDQLSDKPSDQEDSVLSPMRVSHVINFHLRIVLLKICDVYNRMLHSL